mmetsp:Transcript_73754/g.190317  ORF Transcript_73754/g.190317 Transcript_73754/m.190317 type:complete len:272 (+) Transcript_73754:275-1090(+)
MTSSSSLRLTRWYAVANPASGSLARPGDPCGVPPTGDEFVRTWPPRWTIGVANVDPFGSDIAGLPEALVRVPCGDGTPSTSGSSLASPRILFFIVGGVNTQTKLMVDVVTRPKNTRYTKPTSKWDESACREVCSCMYLYRFTSQASTVMTRQVTIQIPARRQASTVSALGIQGPKVEVRWRGSSCVLRKLMKRLSSTLDIDSARQWDWKRSIQMSPWMAGRCRAVMKMMETTHSSSFVPELTRGPTLPGLIHIVATVIKVIDTMGRMKLMT